MRKQSRIIPWSSRARASWARPSLQIFAKWYDRVYLYGVSESSLEKADYLISINQKSQVEQGALTQEESRALLERITMTTSKDCFAQADFVLEAIPEKMDVKHTFWEEVSRMVGEDVVLATNTSGMSVTEIAQAVYRPERFAGHATGSTAPSHSPGGGDRRGSQCG